MANETPDAPQQPLRSNPDIAIFPDNHLRLKTPAGRDYRARIRHHDDSRNPGEQWIQVLDLQPADGKVAQAQAAQFAETARRPAYFPEQSKVKPLTISFNRLPSARRNDGNANMLIAELWDPDGLWTLLISPSSAGAKTLYHGSIVPHKAEIDNNPASKIAQYQRTTLASGEPEPDGTQARAGAEDRVRPKAERSEPDAPK